MTSRTVVLPLSFGLSAVLLLSSRAGARDTPPPARVYTNADLDRVRPFRDETGASSTPAVPVSERAPSLSREGPRGHGESYWRRQAERVRTRLRELGERREALRARLAAREDEARHVVRRGRASSGPSSRSLELQLASLERRMRELEEDLAERARHDGALPGWLR